MIAVRGLACCVVLLSFGSLARANTIDVVTPASTAFTIYIHGGTNTPLPDPLVVVTIDDAVLESPPGSDEIAPIAQLGGITSAPGAGCSFTPVDCTLVVDGTITFTAVQDGDDDIDQEFFLYTINGSAVFNIQGGDLETNEFAYTTVQATVGDIPEPAGVDVFGFATLCMLALTSRYGKYSCRCQYDRLS